VTEAGSRAADTRAAEARAIDARAIEARAAGLWLAAQQEIARRSAHEDKNALTGAVVNLEVVRARLARPGAPAEAATGFAETAASQFERVTAYVEALINLARPAHEPADVAAVLRSLHPLLEAAATAHDIQLSVTTFEPGARATSTDAQVTRLVLVAALLAATGRGAHSAECHAALDEEACPAVVVVRVARDGMPPPLDDAVAAVAAEAGVRIAPAPDAITLTFPAAAG